MLPLITNYDGFDPESECVPLDEFEACQDMCNFPVEDDDD